MILSLYLLLLIIYIKISKYLQLHWKFYKALHCLHCLLITTTPVSLFSKFFGDFKVITNSLLVLSTLILKLSKIYASISFVPFPFSSLVH